MCRWPSWSRVSCAKTNCKIGLVLIPSSLQKCQSQHQHLQTSSHKMVGALQVTRTIFLDLVDLIINNSWERWGAQLAPSKRSTKCQILSNNAEIVSDRIAIKYNQTIRLSNLRQKWLQWLTLPAFLGLTLRLWTQFLCWQDQWNWAAQTCARSWGSVATHRKIPSELCVSGWRHRDAV